MVDEPLSITTAHEDVLATIGPSGGTSIRLRELANGREIYELERAGYVWRDFVGLRESGTDNTEDAIWYLTDRGAEAVGIDPKRIYRR
jgi:hypothetical protein